MKQKKRKYCLLTALFVGTASFSQVLHHQMFTSQGSTKHIKSGLFVNQSIGQSTVGGTYSKKGLIVQQGFQQNGMMLASILFMSVIFPESQRHRISMF